MQKRKLFLSVLLSVMLLSSCSGDEEPTPTPTAVPATATQVPTATSLPPTSTSEAPSATATLTQQPVDTVVPLTDTVAYPPPAQANASVTSTNGVTTSSDSSSYPPPAQADGSVTSTNVVTTSRDSSSYPPPAPTATDVSSRIPVVPFVLERPVMPGATVVRGTGPANVPILIVDVGFMGDVLGQGTISEDGKFEIEVKPLVENAYIGVAVAELDGTDFAHEDFLARGFNGPGAEQVPQVGFIFDTLVVRK